VENFTAADKAWRESDEHLRNILVATFHMLSDAEEAWDTEASAGRVSAWPA